MELRIESPPENPLSIENPTVWDLLPPEMEFAGNLVYTFASTSTTNNEPYFEVIPNWDGTGRTMLKWWWDSTNPMSIDPDGYWQTFHINFDWQIPWSTPDGNYITRCH